MCSKVETLYQFISWVMGAILIREATEENKEFVKRNSLVIRMKQEKKEEKRQFVCKFRSPEILNFLADTEISP